MCAVNFNYLLAHLLPCCGVKHREIVLSGTSWKYFLSELVTMLLFCIFFPGFSTSFVGRLSLVVHTPLHVFLVIGDYLSHQFILNRALKDFRT